MTAHLLTLLDLTGCNPDSTSITGDVQWPNVADDVPASDVRLKESVERVGVTKHDLPLYRFRYKGQAAEYSGVMAQDVLDVMPEAVSVGPDGFYRVDYDMLGIAMTRLG